MTRVVKNKEVKARYSEGSLGTINFEVYNVSTTLLIDLRKPPEEQLTIIDDGIDLSSPSTEYKGVSGFVYNLLSRGSDIVTGIESTQEGGWHLTSEFAKEVNGPKANSKSDAQTTNVDLILAAISAVTKSPDVPSINGDLGIAKAINVMNKLISNNKSDKGPDIVKCGSCGSLKLEGTILENPTKDTAGLNIEEPIKEIPYEKFHTKK